MTAAVEPIVGRYLHLDCAGRHYRIYFESAGEGIPLVCLHTAGSDTRQYRGLMNAAMVTDRFRVIAFDQPWHGKSSPPAGWEGEEYRLTADSYTGIVMAFVAALGLDRPVVMGCSIGGRVVLHLALRHAGAFRALIGLESSAHVDPYYDTSWLHRPDVHGGEVAAGVVSGLIAPQAPASERWETLWHYMQGGPGVFRGDLYFYGIDGDVRSELGRIDTAQLSALPLDRRIRLFVHPGRHAGGGARGPRRAGHDHERIGALPDEREPRAVHLPPQTGARGNRRPGLEKRLAGLSGRCARAEEPAEIGRLGREAVVALGQGDPRLLASGPQMHRRPDPGGVVERAGTRRAHRRALHRVAANPRAAFRADPAVPDGTAVGDARDQPRLDPGQPERLVRNDNRDREGAAGHPLAVGAVTGVYETRCLGDLVAQLAALAAAGQRELHRPIPPR
jgi:pimeloyl-ACP methyl ester carboxylesterase